MDDFAETQGILHKLRESETLAQLATRLYDGDMSKTGMLSDVTRGIRANVAWDTLQDLRKRLGLPYKVRVIAEVSADTAVRVVEVRPYRHAGRWWRPCLSTDLRSYFTGSDVERILRLVLQSRDSGIDLSADFDDDREGQLASSVSELED